MNYYEQKQQSKKERFQELAERKYNESNARYERAKRMSELIPFGQPILVGHHSEKSHRSHLNKVDNDMRKSIELEKTATYYKNKAENIGNGGISSDNPDAVSLLEVKLAKLEDRQKDMKEQNAEARANKTEKPFESYQLSNNNANIRSTKQRIERLKRQSEITPSEDIIGNGYKVVENKEQNRIQFIFEGKPEPETRQLLKSHGFRWSPYNTAWQRMLNANGRYNTKLLIKSLT